jgi:hypothetical protein
MLLVPFITPLYTEITDLDFYIFIWGRKFGKICLKENIEYSVFVNYSY